MNKKGWKFSPFIDGLNKKPDVNVYETIIYSLPGYKAFNSIRAEKTGDGLSIFVEMIYFLKFWKCLNQTPK